MLACTTFGPTIRMFNPDPRIQRVPILAGHDCLVIDDALLEPARLVSFAQTHRTSFDDSAYNAYPGIELTLPDAVSARLDEFFARHIRGRLGARRTLRMYSRLALVTRRPEQLQPRQWICHRDRMEIEPGRTVAACVLYLFHDASLGGTSFFRPLRPALQIDQLVHASGVMPGDEFSTRFGIAPGYPLGSNAWFEKRLTVPAAFNRLIFYDGMLFHAGDISAPDRLSDDPAVGRLTLNGFFTCRKAV